ncbi:MULTISPECIES: cobalt-precorrin-6A reductase [unclassified Dietzia]|uniref:cobalt-precorrin-6A reductase n=1 Tax=unclassified Dietzia TaxID=2617939 RepID=UPI001E320580|nr:MULTISPECIES: cobalt-precorrin-6A reductase [unclassified Dietzia]
MFVGVGTGDADLLTVRASRLLADCGTCLFEGVHGLHEVLSLCPPRARLVDTTGMPVSDVVAEIREASGRGDRVVRLIPGEPSMYRGVAQEVRALEAAGVGWQIVPGVPVVAAAAAALGIELAAPGGPGSVHIVRPSHEPGASPSDGERLPPLPTGGADLTVVPHVGPRQLAGVIRELVPAHGPECTVGIVVAPGREGEITVVGTLGDIADRMTGTDLPEDMVVCAGPALGSRRDDEGLDGGPAPVGSPSPESARGSVAPSVTPSASRMPAPTPGRILLLGGTEEARRLAELMVTAGLDVVTSLTGTPSRPRMPRGEVRIGGFGGPEDLARWLRESRASAVIDASDPFATGVSASATRAARETGTPLLRVLRPPWAPEDGDRWIPVADVDAASRLVRERFRRPMLTVGRGGPTAFAGDTRGSYLIRCAEPPPGLLPHRYLLVLDRGPFGIESERTLMSRHRIDVLVTRNTGAQSTVATLRAARDLRIPVVMVDRPSGSRPGQTGRGDTVHSVDEAARWLVHRFGSH